MGRGYPLEQDPEENAQGSHPQGQGDHLGGQGASHVGEVRGGRGLGAGGHTGMAAGMTQVAGCVRSEIVMLSYHEHPQQVASEAVVSDESGGAGRDQKEDRGGRLRS